MAFYPWVIGLVFLIDPLHLPAADFTGWIGTYTTPNPQHAQGLGIYGFQWNSNLGVISLVIPAVATSNPSFLTLHPNGRYIYSVNENSSSSGSDTLTAFAIVDQGDTKVLKAIGSVDSRGSAPCHLSVDRTGHWLFAANYLSGTIAVFPIQSDGRLGEHTQVIQQSGSGPDKAHQQSAHAHEVVQSPDGKFLLAADLGADRIFIYRFNEKTGELLANSPAAVSLSPGYGPRHLLFSSDAQHVYVVAELAAMLVTFHWDHHSGSLTFQAAVSTLPGNFLGNKSGAEIALAPFGHHLYVSNRGDSNSIAIMRIGSDGLPKLQASVSSGGRTPRFISIDPTGRFLIALNQDSGTLVSFKIESESGMLIPTQMPVAIPAPVDLLFNTMVTVGQAR